MTESDENSEQRKLQYRTLINEIEDIQENEDKEIENDPEMIDRILNTVDNMLINDETIDEKLGHTDEFVLDATVIAEASSLLNRYTNSIEPVLDTYNPKDLAGRIKQNFVINAENSDDPRKPTLNFTNLFEIARKIVKPVPEYHFIGKPDPTMVEKEKKQRHAGPKMPKNLEKVEKKTVEKLNSAEKEEDSVDDTVKFIFWALKNEYKENNSKGINYFSFAFDPESFGKTVENIFHISFLVRDSKISISTDEKGIFFLTPVSSKESKNETEQSNENFSQHIISVDTEIWKTAVKVFNLKRSPLKKWKIEWERRKAQK